MYNEDITREQMTKEIADLRKRLQESENAKKYVFSKVADIEKTLEILPFFIDILDEKGNIIFVNQKDKVNIPDCSKVKCWEVYKKEHKQCPECILKKDLSIGEWEIWEMKNCISGKACQISYTAIIYDGEKAILRIFNDISKQKQAEHNK